VRAGSEQTNYEEAMKQVGNFQTIEHFWRIYNHMLRPSEFKTTTDYHLFKHGIKPTWEDPQNERGGKWMVRLKKGLSTRYWEELIIAIIGEQFDVGHEICGAVVSVRNNEDIISVWNKNAENTEAKNKIRDQMRRILKLPSFINVEYKKHQDSIVDKSSFRNTVVWRSESNNDRGPRKPRTEWGDRNDHSGKNWFPYIVFCFPSSNFC
jgi:translation initiation factor 4E